MQILPCTFTINVANGAENINTAYCSGEKHQRSKMIPKNPFTQFQLFSFRSIVNGLLNSKLTCNTYEVKLSTLAKLQFAWSEAYCNSPARVCSIFWLAQNCICCNFESVWKSCTFCSKRLNRLIVTCLICCPCSSSTVLIFGAFKVISDIQFSGVLQLLIIAEILIAPTIVLPCHI